MPCSGEGDLPSLVLLEQFSQLSLRQWLASARKLDELQSVLFFVLELARQQFSKELIEAIRTRVTVVDSISVEVSTRPHSRNSPALYIAEDYPTAIRERFGSNTDVGPHGLTGAELALRAPASFTHVVLRG